MISGHQGNNCPENNRCGINDCKSTLQFHLHFERRSNPPKPVDAAVETRSAFGDSAFAGDVLLRTVTVWLIGSGGRSIQVNAFVDDGSDSTYVRDDIVSALCLKTDEQTLSLTTLTESCISLKSKKFLADDKESTAETWTLNEMCQGLSVPDWNQHKVKWEHLKNIPFPKAPGRKTIDSLIGSDHPELTLALTKCYGTIGAPVEKKKKKTIGVDLCWTFTRAFFSKKECLRQNRLDPDLVRDPSR